MSTSGEVSYACKDFVVAWLMNFLQLSVLAILAVLLMKEICVSLLY